VTFKIQALLAHDEIPRVENLGNDVDTVPKLEVDEIGFAVLDLVDRGLFLGAGLDVSEFVVVIDGSDRKWRTCGLCVVGVVEG
jgi:hypothetical protein